jgi:O-methyltransferase
MDLTETLQQAITHHKAGELVDAEQLYRSILNEQASHPDANHNLGIILKQGDQTEASVTFFKTALDANPNQGQFWISYIDALIHLGRLDAARSIIEQGQSMGLKGEIVDQLVARFNSQPDTTLTSKATSKTFNSEKLVISENYLPKLQPVGMHGHNFNIIDIKKFDRAISLLRQSLFDGGRTLFCADNLITWNRNYSFLRQDFFLNILNDKEATNVEKSIIWRTYILLFFAEYSSFAEGDYLECGVLEGSTAHTVIKKINFSSLGKEYYLFDLFEWEEGDIHTKFNSHNNSKLYEKVVQKFSKYPFVHVIKGSVPQSFAKKFPEKVAFAHIDMNAPDPEVGALKAILPKLNKGGAIILDDYGWWGYSAQKMAIDPILESYDVSVLELPTGQGVILKR